MGVKNAVKRKSIFNSGTPDKLRKTNGVVNQKSPKTFTKKQKTPPKKNKQIPEEEECSSSSESEYEGEWKIEDLMNNDFFSNEEESDSDDNEEEEVEQNDSDEEIDINEESDSDENILQDFEEANDDEEDSDSDEENNEVEQNDSGEEIDMNEESDSDEENVLQDFEDANDKEESDSYEDKNDSENEKVEQNDSDEENILQDFEDADDSEQESDSNEEINEDQNDNEKKELSKYTKTHLNRCKYTVYVTGLQGADTQIPNIFKDCKYTYYIMLKNHKIDKPAGSAFVNFDEEENYKKALEKNGTSINGVTITVLPKKSKEEENFTYNIFVRNLNPNSKIENIFSDCKIITHRIYPHSKSGFLLLGNEDSIQNALKKDQTEHDGHVIYVYRKDCSVFVRRFPKNIQIDDFFSNCKIRSCSLKKYKKNLNGTIYFEDILSYKNAIAKNGTKIDGKTIIVEPVKPILNKKRNNKINMKNEKLVQLKARAWQLSTNKKNLKSEGGHRSILLRKIQTKHLLRKNDK